MRGLTIALLGAGIVGAGAAGYANAMNCYVVFDSNNSVVYQDPSPPVDMSERGDAARAAMRQRGQFLMLMDAPQCPRLIAASGPTGGPATVDQIVSTMRSYGASNPGASPSARSAGSTTSTAAR